MKKVWLMMQAGEKVYSMGDALREKRLTVLPPEIWQLTALTRLSLNNNELMGLPPEIGRRTALTEFYLQNNQLMALPPELGQLGALTEFVLSGNESLDIPWEVLGKRPKGCLIRLRW